MEHYGCSIEMEPRTLNEGELHNAREAAMDIIQNKEPGEASDIFTEGMKAITCTNEKEKEVEKRIKLRELVDIKEGSDISKGLWDLPCTATTMEVSPDTTKIREPLSSPF